jgi:hypothetical protein
MQAPSDSCHVPFLSFVQPVADLPLHVHLINMQVACGRQMTAENHEFCTLSNLVLGLFALTLLNPSFKLSI